MTLERLRAMPPKRGLAPRFTHEKLLTRGPTKMGIPTRGSLKMGKPLRGSMLVDGRVTSALGFPRCSYLPYGQGHLCSSSLQLNQRQVGEKCTKGFRYDPAQAKSFISLPNRLLIAGGCPLSVAFSGGHHFWRGTPPIHRTRLLILTETFPDPIKQKHTGRHTYIRVATCALFRNNTSLS